MIGNSFARLTGSKRNLLALLATSFVFTSGCANMSSTAPVSNSLSVPATLSGRIHGGNQPVIGATVTLWYAGQTGNPGFPVAQAASTTTDGTGSFSFTKNPTNGQSPAGNMYSCPSNTDPLVYVMSNGGNTQNNGNATQSNAAASFIAVYDVCSRLNGSNFVYMSEVTTAATMAAIGQFFNPSTETITADGTGQQYIVMLGISKTIALLADTTTGLSKGSTDIASASPVGHNGNVNPNVVVTATPEQSKLNLIANILSACVNSASETDAPCVSLLGAAAPPIANTTYFNGTYNSGKNKDTLQALYAMFQNPSSNSSSGTGGTANITTLFGLAGGVGAPYQPALGMAPTDWTLGIQYTSKGNVSCGTPSGGAGDFINSPVDITVDAFNNVWFANSQTGGNLSELSATGAPATCVNLDPGNATSLAIDSMQNVWVGAGTSMYRYSPGGFGNLPALSAGTQPYSTGGVTPLAVTADGINNVYYTGTASSTGSAYILAGAANTSSVSPTQISSTVGASPLRMFPDFKGSATQGNIWVTSGSTYVSQLQPSTGSGNMGGFLTNPFTVSGTDSYGVSVSHANNIFVSDLTSGAVTRLDYNGTTWAPASSPWPFTAASTAGISSPTGIAIDGRLNTWIPNNANGTSTGSLSEVSFFGADPLSPSTGFQKSSTYLNSARAVAIDQAGNVWVVGDGNNYITELVGSAVPIFQPMAIGLKYGRFQNLP